MAAKKIGVLLMTYGSPKTLDAIPAYLSRIYGGKKAPEEVIAEFRRRYERIGGSPLVRITQEQAVALEKKLSTNAHGIRFYVRAGMRFSEPFIDDVVKELAKDADHIIGIILSPQYSPIIMHGYIRELEQAVARLNRTNLTFQVAKDWHLQQYFLQALAQRVEEALSSFSSEVRTQIPVLFTAHSMPRRVIDKEPDYITRLQETAAGVAELLKLSAEQWQFCYQSAGHTPEEWLKPDFADIMPELKKAGKTHVLIAPVQFLSDHLEVLYDIDIGAREQAEKHGITFIRTQSLNTSPVFIDALREVVLSLL